ncbi:MFS transporter [Microvirga flavescens]|uniref:MFS transporter n=1 Tax=Microvirga flavescens TaxID=2249811 RepID=UPI000DDBBC83|nr:MFS transporter [Microvirga flavescens]
MSPIANDALARRNALVLSLAQAFSGANPAIVVSLGGLVGQMLVTDKQFATLPVSLFNLGLALGTIPAAMIMRGVGRRGGYVFAGSVGILAGCLAAFGIVTASFLIFCIGTTIAGFWGSFTQSYRFAATDAASDSFKARAISWVMIGGLVAGIIGPQTVIWTRDVIVTAPFAGAFLAQSFLALLTIAVVVFLRSPPVSAQSQTGGRPLREIVTQPRFIVAVTSGVVSAALMTFVMTAAPLAMIGCGHSVSTAALGIQWHVLAMYGPSFFTGRLIQRFGKERVTAVGLVLIAVSATVGLSGLTVAHFWGALILLGIGWNFGFIGATALVTDCYRSEERARVQAINDFLVFGFVALASFSSGNLLSTDGWGTLNLLVYPPVAVALGLLAWQSKKNAVVAA